jgi:two-component system sensor histidine kinase DesK
VKLLDRWRKRSRAARVDLYVRGSFYTNLAAASALVVVGLAPGTSSARAWAVTATVTAHAVLCGLLTHAGINHYLGRRARPVRLMAICAAATALAVAVLASGTTTDPLLFTPVLSFLPALTAAVRARSALAAGIVCVVLAHLSGPPAPPNRAIAYAFLAAVAIAVTRLTLWMLGTVWELDAARQAQASLAVAEERLRFSRDLHDVVGRSLSAIALKSELAVALSRRGRAQATDEMIEVHRIAHESLAELRAVVGGYRSADLGTELAGARALLTSAGIACDVVGDGTGLPLPVQATLAWAVREAATNVLRHSDARTCTIAVHHDDAGSTVVVDNDGAHTLPGPRPGTGLVGVAERVAELGGTVTAERCDSGTFRFTARVPRLP